MACSDGEFVVTDVEVVLIDAQQRLVAEAGAATATHIGGVKLIVASGTILTHHGDIEMRRSGRIDGESDKEEVPRCFVKLTAWIAYELRRRLIEQNEQRDRAACEIISVSIEDLHRDIDRLKHNGLSGNGERTDAQTLIGRREDGQLGSRVIKVAHAIKAFSNLPTLEGFLLWLAATAPVAELIAVAVTEGAADAFELTLLLVPMRLVS